MPRRLLGSGPDLREPTRNLAHFCVERHTMLTFGPLLVLLEEGRKGIVRVAYSKVERVAHEVHSARYN